MNVNIWDQGDTLAALVRSVPPVDAARLADTDVALEDLIGADMAEAESGGSRRTDGTAP